MVFKNVFKRAGRYMVSVVLLFGIIFAFASILQLTGCSSSYSTSNVQSKQDRLKELQKETEEALSNISTPPLDISHEVTIDDAIEYTNAWNYVGKTEPIFGIPTNIQKKGSKYIIYFGNKQFRVVVTKKAYKNPDISDQLYKYRKKLKQGKKITTRLLALGKIKVVDGVPQIIASTTTKLMYQTSKQIKEDSTEWHFFW